LQNSLATMRAPDQLSARPSWPGLTRLPRLVARGYPTVMPGRSSGPYHLSTTKAPRIQAPMRDQFVILIGGRVHIPLTARSARVAGLISRRLPNRARNSRPASPLRTAAPGPARQKYSIAANYPQRRPVQNQPICVVIPLRVDRSSSAACSRLADKLYCRAEPAYPPRAGPCGPPSLSPPARGDH